MFRQAGTRFCLRSHQRTKHEKASLVFESHHPEPRTRASKIAGGPESRGREEADPVREPDLWSAHPDPPIASFRTLSSENHRALPVDPYLGAGPSAGAVRRPGPVPKIGRLRRERRHRMPVARSEQGLATIHNSVWRARIAPACPQYHESSGDQDPCLERTGIPTGPGHLAQDLL
eukprot:scaffold26226_cov79-Phaeocystis_antarctica.AAC.5